MPVGSISPRLILGSCHHPVDVAADVVILWQFHVVRTQAGRLTISTEASCGFTRAYYMLAFHDRLDGWPTPKMPMDW